MKKNKFKLYFIAPIQIFIILIGLFGFVFNNWNPAEWTEAARLLLVLFYVAAVIFAAMILNFDKK